MQGPFEAAAEVFSQRQFEILRGKLLPQKQQPSRVLHQRLHLKQAELVQAEPEKIKNHFILPRQLTQLLVKLFRVGHLLFLLVILRLKLFPYLNFGVGVHDQPAAQRARASNKARHPASRQLTQLRQLHNTFQRAAGGSHLSPIHLLNKFIIFKILDLLDQQIFLVPENLLVELLRVGVAGGEQQIGELVDLVVAERELLHELGV